MIIHRPALDLDRSHFRRRFGDIEAFGTWFHGDGSVPMPCIVLLPAVRYAGQPLTPVMIPQTDAWLWSPTHGRPDVTAQRSLRYAAVLGLNTADIGPAFQIASMMEELLPDLLTIPPLPASEKEVVADASSTDQNGRTTTVEILDYT